MQSSYLLLLVAQGISITSHSTHIQPYMTLPDMVVILHSLSRLPTCDLPYVVCGIWLRTPEKVTTQLIIPYLTTAALRRWPIASLGPQQIRISFLTWFQDSAFRSWTYQ